MVNGVLGRWCGVVDFGVVINALVVGVGGFRWRKIVCVIIACFICVRNGNRDVVVVVVLFFYFVGGLYVD